MMVAQPPDQARRVREFFEDDSNRYWRERYLTPSGEQLSYVTRKGLTLDMIGRGPGRLLDIGSGPGILTRELVARGFRIYSVDLAFSMLTRAREMVHQPETRFIQGDLTRLPFRDAAFERVICVGVLAYLPEPATGLAELARVMRPGGVAVLQTSNRYSPTATFHSIAKPVYRRLVGTRSDRSRPVLGVAYRSHAPAEFRRVLDETGFRVVDSAFYDFRPPLLERLLPRATLRIARWLQSLERSRALGWLGEGLLVKAVRV